MLLIPSGAAAQIVNVESLLTGEPSPGLQGALQAGFTLIAGNSDARRADGSGLIRWRRERLLLQLVGSAARETARGVEVSDNALGHLRAGWQTSDRLRMEALLQVQRDDFLRLRRRILAGAGMRVGVARLPERLRLDAALIVMREWERLAASEPAPDWRGSFLLSLGWTLSKGASVGAQIYLQPLLADFGDRRTLLDASLTARIAGSVSLVTALRVAHDSRPPAGVERLDTYLRNAVAVTF